MPLGVCVSDGGCSTPSIGKYTRFFAGANESKEEKQNSVERNRENVRCVFWTTTNKYRAVVPCLQAENTKFYHVSWIFISATWFALNNQHGNGIQFFGGISQTEKFFGIFSMRIFSQFTLPEDMFVCMYAIVCNPTFLSLSLGFCVDDTNKWECQRLLCLRSTVKHLTRTKTQLPHKHNTDTHNYNN